MDQEGDSLDDREPTLLSHLLQYLIGLITFGVGHFSLGGRQPPVRLLVCNTSAANLLEACDVSALASHGQCRRGLGDFRHPCGAVSNAGEPMSCGRTVRSFTAEVTATQFCLTKPILACHMPVETHSMAFLSCYCFV